MSAPFAARLHADLEARRRAGLYRARRVRDGMPGAEGVIDGRGRLVFCSNDYLGLAAHPALGAALAEGARRYGTGSGAAHLITGHCRAHHALEEELAAFVGRPRALLFSTGYMANLGAVAALLGRGDRVFADRLNHASLLDAARLSGARLVRYRHADADALGRALARPPKGRAPARPPEGRALVVSDGVFSMDGDLAPLPALARTARAHGAWLMVDDAHGLGVVGPRGRGVLDHYALDADAVPVLVGTLGKAFGTFGAFVAGDEALIETLIQRARTYIYTTAPPPALAEATRAALRTAAAEPWRRERLHALVARFRAGAQAAGLPLGASTTPIQPLVTGSAARAVALSAALEARGILVSAIRPPTVPQGTARLRVTFSALHEEAHVDRLLAALAEVWPAAEAGCA